MFWKRAGFTLSWPFTAGTDAQYSFGPSIGLAGGVARLVGNDQVDDDNTASGFGGATFSGAVWDATNSDVRLTQTGTPTNTAELDSSWTPKWSTLTGYWKLNTDGADSLGTNSCTAAGGLIHVTGKVGTGAASFNGTDAHYACGNVGLNPTTKLSASVWVYQSGATSYQWILGKGVQYELVANGGLVYVVVANTSPGWTFTGTSTGYTLPLNTWVHLAFSYDAGASTLKFYVNGSQFYANTSATGAIATGASNFWIGSNRTNATQTFNGLIDDLAMWNDTLSTTDVQTIYSRQAAKYSGTVTSRVMDALAVGQNWTTLSWTPTLPFFKGLPDYASGAIQNETSNDYPALVGSTGSVGDNNLMSGIVGLWHLDGTEFAALANNASITESSGRGLACMAKNANGTGMGFSRSKIQQGVVFDGTDDYIDCGTAALGIANAFTVGGWAYASADKNGRIAAKHGASYGWLLSRVAGTNNVEFRLSTDGANWLGGVTVAGTFPLNQWVHIVGRYDGAYMRVYINGTESVGVSFPSAQTGNVNDSTQSLLIGKDALNSNSFHQGILDEVAVWNRALDPKEILQLYRRGANRIKHQVRICTAADCSDDSSGANWKGPDGTNQSYFSELYNMSSQSASPSGTVNATLPSMLFSNFTSPVGTSRYFQYRTVLESDDSGTGCNYGSGATWCSPELKSVTVDPVHYDLPRPRSLAPLA